MLAMERTPIGTAVGVDDPYAHVDRCDHLTDDGSCRFAIESGHLDPSFAREREHADFACSEAASETWSSCAHFCSRTDSHECVRCGLEERTNALNPHRRPLIEEHHLSYATDGDNCSHEITVSLCRWCHAKVHSSWARITDDIAPDPAAIAERERRRAEELEECSFQTAAARQQQF